MLRRSHLCRALTSTPGVALARLEGRLRISAGAVLDFAVVEAKEGLVQRALLDLSNVATLDQEIHTAEASSAQSVTIDLRGLAFMDSSGVRTILDAQHRSRLNGRLRLRRGSRSVQSIFRLTGTEESLPFEAGEENPAPDRQSQGS